MRHEIIPYDTDITRFGPGRRDLYIIHYVISGVGYFNGNRVSKGQGFLITPGMAEHYYPDKANPWTFLWVIFSGSEVEKIFKEYNADPQTHIFEYSNIDSIMKAVNTIIGNKHRYTTSELFEFYLNIFNNHRYIHRTHQSSSDIYCEYAVNYINLNLYRTVTVEELTDILGITQPYLYKIFTNKYGISPKKYITDCKLSKAKQLLTETDLPVCEVAASVGDADSLSFSKQFKKLTGYSPTTFREL